MNSQWNHNLRLLLLSLLAVFFASGCLDCVALDTVKREICLTNGTVWVEDSIHMSGAMVVQKDSLSDLYTAARDNRTNLLQEIQVLLAGDDLEMQEHQVQFHDDYLDLQIRSKIKAPSSSKPVHLRLVSTFAGSHVPLEPAAGEGGIDLLIVESGGNWVLLFPTFKPVHDDLDFLAKGFGSFDSMFAGSCQFDCVVRQMDKATPLLHWNQQTKTATQINLAALKEINAVHELTGNDELTLATSLQLAKGGGYFLGRVVSE